MSFLYQQLPLAVQLSDQATFNNYYPAGNALAVNEIRRQLDDGEHYIFLCGPSGSGRSHLLQASCHNAGEQGLSSVYLPLDELTQYPPADLFEGLAALSLICLDNIEAVLGDARWEEALFHLFNQSREANKLLLIAADRGVKELPIKMADLSSRLAWGAIYQLKGLEDQQCIEALKFRAQQRGVDIADDVAQYIYKRCQRDMAALLNTLEVLDSASLQQRRKLTIPFVRETMHW